ncbi:response regulator [Clostridium pasteurianum]|uniref:Stage 0 sporulation protein A homolog n=1 Tax=Clostridium pasteurianum BC1 TaxID=86416 RepID=R4K8Z7_CLOPA|nr:response regulator [Clostridium pasteurianum]AGK99003.1 response regulator containing CheY-like receiver domain and AraC-type DNA-binding domain [Clostridium pasteurianum BC1]
MNFFIVDDDIAIRSMLSEIIEDYDLGTVVGEAENGSFVNIDLLTFKKVDILIIDLLMPVKDGIEAIKDLGSSLNFKIIMLSQIEDKKIIGEAYSLAVEYYITKPINRLEVIKIIEKVTSNVKLQKSINDIQQTINMLGYQQLKVPIEKPLKKTILEAAQFILTDLGMISENGSKDILDIIQHLANEDKELYESEFPSLKALFTSISVEKLGNSCTESDIKKEIKASEQRIRRAIFQSINYIASLGLTDYGNPKFEEYASKFFDFAEVRKKMLQIENKTNNPFYHIRINIKKFIKVLYIEAKKI